MDKDEIWNNALAVLLENADEDDPKSVFLNLLNPVGIFGDQFVLLSDSLPVESWVRKNYLEEIQDTIRVVSGMPLTIGLASDSSQKENQQPQNVVQFQQQPQEQPLPSQEPDWLNEFVDPSTLPSGNEFTRRREEDHPRKKEDRGEPSQIPGNEALFMKCTFDSFVVGSSNNFARGAALAVAEQPGIAYNPLFIYGNSGLGKTHLLVSIANYVQQNYPQMTTRYASANKFLDDYVKIGMQENRWDIFNKTYHQVDILLIDDVQYLAEKEGITNELFNIFNEMTSMNKQVVLSADRAPKDINMDERMKSRFISGLLADVKPPDYETRLAILKNFLSRVSQTTSFHGDIPDEVLSYIAEVATSNIRVLEGAITRLASNMTVFKKDIISVDEAQELLKDFFPTTTDRKIDIALIQNEVEHFFGITHEDMISSKRSKGITTPRHIAIYLSRYLTEESLESIGKKFGGRDHTTVMHSVNKIERDQKDNRILFNQLEQLNLRLKEHS